jgi:hypothetical protein
MQMSLVAAANLGADIIITADAEILRFRNNWPLDQMNLLSPHEAFPLICAWARAVGESYLLGPVNISDWYSWILTRALLPAAWPGYAAFVAGRRVFPHGEELFNLASSVLGRLDRLVTMLDRLLLMWQRRTPHGIGAELDGIVLGTWAMQDNLALLSGKYLGVAPLPLSQWGLLSQRWQEAARATGDRGRRLVDYIERVTPHLVISQQLRHHAVHRDILPTVRDATKGVESVKLSADLLREMRSALQAAGESTSDWGIRNERGPETIPTIEVDVGGVVNRYDMTSAGSAELDPLPFALKLVARVSRVGDDFFRILSPASDSRLASDVRQRLLRLPVEEDGRVDFLFTRPMARAAILASPLSGLVDHFPERADDASTEDD